MERDIDHFDAEELGNGKVSVIAGNRAEEFHPVSYTHLDVYKRQAHVDLVHLVGSHAGSL